MVEEARERALVTRIVWDTSNGYREVRLEFRGGELSVNLPPHVLENLHPGDVVFVDEFKIPPGRETITVSFKENGKLGVTRVEAQQDDGWGQIKCRQCGFHIEARTDDNYNRDHSQIHCHECGEWTDTPFPVE